ncbi:hypothetical protein WMW71_12305 [Flavobacterium buctense]|uniref:Uncharacterized protein n=1 Tax=Flavobacterium buctense TaxID=1648146 RepID=A0ABU9E3D4_9FLAO|nr:hypothetical protein [Flavobacterium buctense]
MKRQKFRFKKEFYTIDGIWNVPGYVINSGYGYDFKTYCCKNCGEIFVEQIESKRKQNSDAEKMIDDSCPNCNVNLVNNLVDYPENIFYENKLFKNNNEIDKIHFKNTEIVEVYSLN